MGEMMESLDLSKDFLIDEYIEKNNSLRDISDKIDCSYATILNYLKRYNIPRRSTSEAVKLGKKKHGSYYIHTDLSPSTNLAYVLGVIEGDGTVRNGQVYLDVISEKFAKAMFNSMKSIGFNVVWNKRKRNLPQHDIYEVFGNSKNFYDWFNSMNYNDIYDFISQDKSMVCAWIRGFYDSEGNIEPSGRVRIVNTDAKLLKLLSRFLNFIDIEHKFLGPYKRDKTRKDMYRIDIPAKFKNKLFILINPTIKGCN